MMKCSVLAFLVTLRIAFGADAPETLPGTTRWNFPGDIVAEQYRELRTFYERQIADAANRRHSAGAAQPSRADFRALIGATDKFLPPLPEVEPLADFGSFTAALVQWPILRSGMQPGTLAAATTGVREYGVVLQPKSAGPHPAVIVVADALESAADITGLTDRLPLPDQLARSLAARGCIVFAPFLVQRRAFSEPWTNDRSWLFRLAYQTGHHLIGSEVQQVSSAYDYLRALPGVDESRIALAGSGQGGLIAFYAGAADERFSATLVRNYFDNRSRAYEEPEDRLVWNQLTNFGDAEIARLVTPRKLIVEGGGPGAAAEFRFIAGGHARLVTEGTGLGEFAQVIGAAAVQQPSKPDRMISTDRVAQIANAQFSQWQMRYRNAAIESYAVREGAWRADTSSVESYRRWAKPKLDQYFELSGRYPDPTGAAQAQSLKLYDTDEFAGYRLSVSLYDDVHAYGILLVPKGIRPGERRPVVFTQHGLGGKPEDALGVTPNKAADDVYSRFGLRLAQRGYIVFAPMISTQTGRDRDQLTRRAHLVGKTPLGMEVKKFGRVLDYLSSLDFVDKERFAFYGLSYGGYTALWTGPGEERFKVVITSGHFNDWSLKTTDLTEGTSFLFYPDNFDMFNFNLLTRFSHAELAMLVAPRAFMIEVGDRDGVVVLPRRLADVEMQRVTDFYRALGIGDRGRIARFSGPHKIDGGETFPFLDRWLQWTPKSVAANDVGAVAH